MSTARETGRVLSSRAVALFETRIATEADDHLGHGTIGARAEVVVVVDDERVVDGAQARQRIGEHGQGQLAGPGENLLRFGHGFAGAFAGEHETRPLPQKALDGLDAGLGQCACGANERAQIEKGAVLRGDTGVASAQSEAVVGGTRMACKSAPAKSGLSGASKGKFTCTGPARCMQAREATCRFGL